MTIAETLKKHIHNDKIAIHYHNEQISYPHLNNLIQSLERKLFTILVNPQHKKIAFLLENKVDFLTLFLAITELGAIALPLDPKWSDEDLDHIMRDATPDLLITNHPERFSYRSITMDQLTHTAESDKRLPIVSDDNLFYLGYTSGTTGKPKGYLRTHASWIHSFTSSDEIFKLTSDERILSPGPLVHSHFLYAAIHTLHIGATLYMTETFDAYTVLNLLQTERISVIYIVPTMFQAMNREFTKTKQVIHSLQKILSSGAKWHPTLRNQAKTLFPEAEVFEFYGASELSFVSYLDEAGFRHDPLSVGQPFPNVEVKVVKEDESIAHVGEIGQLFVKSNLLFHGYLNNEEATKEVLHGKWATVGDLAVIDEAGFIRLVGRKHNMIISGGLNIYPEEVEHVLQKHPAIDEVAVIGVEDDYWGEKVVALIKWDNLQSMNRTELKMYCRKHLASYKCPQTFISITKFPYTSSGKIARKQLIPLLEEGDVIL